MSHALAAMRELHLARVLTNEDPENRGRLEVELLATGLVLWAAVVTNGAGSGYGISLLPKTNEIVVLAFIGPDEDNAFVLGAVWSGGDAQSEDARPVEDIYAITTPGGCKILVDDSGPKIDIETPSGAHLTITDDGGSTITLERGGESVELSDGTISLTSSSSVSIEATQVSISATSVSVDAAASTFSGMVKCDSLTASASVTSPSYTPGAGNVW